MIPLDKLERLNSGQLKAIEQLCYIPCPGSPILGCSHCPFQCDRSEYSLQCALCYAQDKLRRGFEATHYPSSINVCITQEQLDNLDHNWLIEIVKAGDKFDCLNMDCKDCPFTTQKTEYAEQCLFHYAVVKLVTMGYTKHLTRKLSEVWPND